MRHRAAVLLFSVLPVVSFVTSHVVSPDAVGMGVPAVGGILYSLRNEGNLKLSQKLIHTRVYGQMTVVSMVMAMMAFQEMMKRNGGLFEVSELEEEEEGEGVVAPTSS